MNTTGRKFRKKPVVIEAWQLPMLDSETRAFQFGPNTSDPNILFKLEDGMVVEAIIQTLEGVMIARSGDWIIRGVKGELYPCKPDIFAETYEPVEES